MGYTYAIGDIQGCYEPMRKLLEAIPYDPGQDRLWFVGDLVNRGPNNIETLEFVHSLGDSATVTLGNHDLHLLAIHFGGKKLLKGDTMVDVISSSRCDELCQWLRRLPLIYKQDNVVMVHAGIPHTWTTDEAVSRALEVEKVIGGANYVSYFEQMYGNFPDQWKDELQGMDRLRSITNYLTRMRFITSCGRLEFAHKTTLDSAPDGFKAWFQFPSSRSEKIIFGHWAALDGNTDSNNDVVATDYGCVWGRGLMAVRIEDGHRFQWLDNELVTQW